LSFSSRALSKDPFARRHALAQYAFSQASLSPSPEEKNLRGTEDDYLLYKLKKSIHIFGIIGGMASGKRKEDFRVLFWFFLLLLVGGMGAIFIMTLLLPLERQDELIQGVKVKIEKGMGALEIADYLHEERVIRSKSGFLLFSFVSGRADRFIPGVYNLFPSLSIREIVQALSLGPAEVVVSIKEGQTVADIDEELASEGVTERGDIVRFPFTALQREYSFLRQAESFEGFLFPDTYRFAQGTSAEVVLRVMLHVFEEKAWPELEKNEKSAYEILKVASLIEKEALPLGSDREVVSGIIYRRIKLGMPLQIDATIAYAKCGYRFYTCDRKTRRLTLDDLSFETDYNSYLNEGLPPTPIANPSLSAIKAAGNPKKTNYLFYISNPITRRAVFATTFDQHRSNINRYLR